MRWIILTLTLFAEFSPLQALAQPDSAWSKVDTLTSGPFDDTNPVLPHNSDAFVSPDVPLRVVFERHTQAESQIATVSFKAADATWDSVVEVISSEPLPVQQVHPDYAEVTELGETIGMAVWERLQSGKWQIYYSLILESQAAWSSPALLVADTVDNVAVRVRPLPHYGYDSTFLVTWKRGASLRALLWSPSGISQLDTIALAGPGVVDYDVAIYWDQVHLVWTSGASESTLVQYQRLATYPGLSVASQETVLTGRVVSNPRTAVSYFGVPVLLESPTAGGSDIIVRFAASMYSSGYDLSDDSSSVNRNPSAFSFPFITKPTVTASPHRTSSFDACVYEKYRGTDSMLVFLNGGWSDTLRSPGHNAHAVVGSRGFFFASPGYLPIIWESNRTGQSHLYGRWARVDRGDDVAEEPSLPVSYTLEQNYPNPFNPSTTIGYALPHRSHVALTVFNVLGQQVAMLVDGDLEAGFHEVRFSAAGLASGVYFYRLQTPGFVQTHKLLLLR